jgi:hypothetical protein
VHGNARTQTDVARDRAAWQNAERTQATMAGHLTPVFYSEYVLFSPRHVDATSVLLGRVVGAPYGGAAKEDDVLDLVEYLHDPNPNAVGLFGTFSAHENEHYNPATKGSLKYIRHREIKRKDLILTNLEMWLDDERGLRIAESSLSELAQTHADRFPLPAQLPAPFYRNQVRRTRETRTDRDEPQSAPVVSAKTRICVRWEEDPVGWFPGLVTSSRRADVEGGGSRWQTRVQYDNCDGWRNYSAWHFLDGPDAVEWRLCDSSDDEA